MSTPEVEALYRAMSVMDLVILRHAFQHDLHEARGRDLESARFCQDRIDAITRELTERYWVMAQADKEEP